MTTEDEDFLRRSIDDLDREHDAGDLSDEDHAALRARYEAKLAEAVASSSRSGLDATQEPASEPDQNKRRPWVKPVATVVIVAVVAVAAGLLLARTAGERDPGDEITGQAPPSTSEDRLAEAARLFNEGKVVDAAKVYDEVLAEHPDDVAALTYKGWMLRNVGVQGEEEDLRTRGVALIEQALQVDPTYSEGWFFRAIIYLRDEDNTPKAVDALRLALANDPIPEVESAIRELLAEINQGPSTSSTTAAP